MNCIKKLPFELKLFLNISCGLKIIQQKTAGTKIGKRVNAYKDVKCFFKKLVFTNWIFKDSFYSNRSVH